MRRAAIILLTAALQGAAVSAQAGTTADLPPGCDANTYEIVQCQISELAKLNVRLDKAYAGALAASVPSVKEKLEKTQKTWLQFREQNCAYYYGTGEGTFSSVRSGFCMLDLTRTRAKELEDAIRP
jgi:uncharacterized protein YecT (DUF1311 family)